MNIGQAAGHSGLPAKTIRYYEEIGLIRPAAREANGYRDYSSADLHILHFLQRARGIGFSVSECRDLLSLYGDRDRASADVKALAQQRIAAIEVKIEEMQSLAAALGHLVERCAGDDRPDCPILDDLAAGKL
ncbi:MAG: Cu(I)-responsive transcriptional regulator [Alphaproteobacteria bacterium]